MKRLQLPPLLSKSDTSSRVPQLDGIRGTAIILVLIWHYIGVKIDSPANPFVQFASRTISLTWMGVDLFFVLSGFLIGGILLDNREAPHYFKAFYMRRTARIFPLYFAWLFLFVLMSLAAPLWDTVQPLRPLFENPLPLWSYATFTQNIAMALSNRYGPDWLQVTWSLAIEEQFYLGASFLIRFVSRRWLPHVILLLAAAAPLLRLALIFVPNYNTLVDHLLMPTRADSLLIGVLCAYLVREADKYKALCKHTTALYVAFGVLLAGAAVLSFWFNTPATFPMVSLGYTWMALLYACFLLIAITEERGPIKWLTGRRWLRGMGVLAYGVYVLHLPFNIVAHALILNQPAQLQNLSDALTTVVGLVATLVVAYLSWTFFEKKILAWGHAFKYRDTVRGNERIKVPAESVS